MTRRETLQALAERVMRLEGPCEKTDAAILYDVLDVMQNHKGPAYTASLDAAMTLGEKFLLVAMSDIAADGLPGVCLCSDTSTAPPREHWGIALNQSKDETRQQVLARCYTGAVLLALAEQEET